MEIIKSKQTYQPLDRVIIFAHDQSEKFYCETYYALDVRNGRIICENEELVLPLEDARVFNTKEGLMYAFNMSLEYLKEIQHLAQVEKNIIIEQAFLYPGRGSKDESKSNMMQYVIIGSLSLLAIIGMMT
jgi:hypothetical protein